MVLVFFPRGQLHMHKRRARRDSLVGWWRSNFLLLLSLNLRVKYFSICMHFCLQDDQCIFIICRFWCIFVLCSGKNDGSVSGVRYFQCEPRKGVFSRLTRLSLVSLFDYDDGREHPDPKCARSSLSPARSVTSSAGRSSITPTRKVSPPASVKSLATSVKSTPMAAPTGASVGRKVSNPTPGSRNDFYLSDTSSHNYGNIHHVLVILWIK